LEVESLPGYWRSGDQQPVLTRSIFTDSLCGLGLKPQAGPWPAEQTRGWLETHWMLAAATGYYGVFLALLVGVVCRIPC